MSLCSRYSHICDPGQMSEVKEQVDPYAGDVVETVPTNVLQGGFIPVLFQFFDNALRKFDRGISYVQWDYTGECEENSSR